MKTPTCRKYHVHKRTPNLVMGGNQTHKFICKHLNIEHKHMFYFSYISKTIDFSNDA